MFNEFLFRFWKPWVQASTCNNNNNNCINIIISTSSAAYIIIIIIIIISSSSSSSSSSRISAAYNRLKDFSTFYTETDHEGPDWG